MIQIDEADYDQSGGEDKIGKKTEGETKFQKEGRSNPTGKGFHQGITPGDPGPAVAAFSTKEEIAYQRDIIIGPDGYPAAGAKRSGRNDGKILGHAINTNIQEAAQATTQKENEYQYKPRWQHLQYPCHHRRKFLSFTIRYPIQARIGINPFFWRALIKNRTSPILTIYRLRGKFQVAFF
jgi:hypothetical protein